MRALALVVLLASASGCLGAPDAAPAALGEPFPATLALVPDGSLGAAPSDAQRIPLDWGWRQWLDGVEAPAWTSAPATSATLVTAATATIVYEATAPVTSAAIRPEWTIWFGAEERVVDHSFQDGPPQMLPGDRAVVTFEIALPVGGLYVAPGERLVLRIGSYYGDDADRGAIAVVAGGDEPTRIALESVALPAPVAPRATDVIEKPFSLLGGRCVGLDAATDQDLAWVDLVADPAKGVLFGIDVALERVGGDGPPDVDMIVLDSAGDAVAHAAGSADKEGIVLRAANLASSPDQAWRLGIYSCTPQRAEVHVTISMLYG